MNCFPKTNLTDKIHIHETDMRWTLICIYVMASLKSQEQVIKIIFVFFYCIVFLVRERTTLLLEYMGNSLPVSVRVTVKPPRILVGVEQTH